MRRTHIDIIREAGGPHAMARLLHQHVDADESSMQKRVRQWNITGSIPGEYWALLESLSLADTAELAASAAERKGVSVPRPDSPKSKRAA